MSINHNELVTFGTLASPFSPLNDVSLYNFRSFNVVQSTPTIQSYIYDIYDCKLEKTALGERICSVGYFKKNISNFPK